MIRINLTLYDLFSRVQDSCNWKSRSHTGKLPHQLHTFLLSVYQQIISTSFIANNDVIGRGGGVIEYKIRNFYIRDVMSCMRVPTVSIIPL